MTTYTEANPFEFEGVKVFASHTHDFIRMISSDGSLEKGMPREFIDAAHALVEAERTPDQFTPLPIPTVGQFIRAELRDGSVVEGKVTFVGDNDRWALVVTTGGEGFIPLIEDAANGDPFRSDIVAWSPVDRPQPEEPTGLGAVVGVGGEEFVLVTRDGDWWPANDYMRRCAESWMALTQRGPVTVKSAGVEL